MPLPDLIEIVPLDKSVRAEITVPGSKSITNRALILAALADGETILQGALWSEDTQVMVEALQKLGFEIKVEQDPDEFCNRTIKVKGLGGKIPNAGTESKPLEIFVGNAGTAARFLSAFVCLGNGVYRLDGVPRMRERPQAALFDALRELGYRIETPNNKLPAVMYGTGPRGGKCTVSIEESSQFASALLLCAEVGKWQVKVAGENAEESPYVKMTSKLVESLPRAGGTFQIEPDASSGSYFWAAGWIAPGGFWDPPQMAKTKKRFDGSEVLVLLQDMGARASEVIVKSWPRGSLQVDAAFPRIGFEMTDGKTSRLSRRDHLGDSIMTAAVLAPFAVKTIRLTDLNRLRHQETERVVALRTELTKCGVDVVEKGETLTIVPSREKLHGAEIETYNDHRMAMCFAILGLKVPGIKIKNPACVKKTFPNFFQKLATQPPHGLGVTILDGKSGRKLGLEELFAE